MILEVFSDVCDSMILYWCNMAGQRVAHIASYSRELSPEAMHSSG